MAFWVNPHGSTGGGGGGELPDVITWDMIEDKPRRFAPTAHTHEIEEIVNLEETIANIYNSINNKVEKISGKGLSEEDFTTALKEKLIALDPSDKGVISVNGITGEHIVITKENLELGNVLNIEQASKEDLELLTARVKELEENQAEGAVLSVNGKTGEVTLDKTDINLDNVDNIKQASKEEFDNFKSTTEEALTKKVDKAIGKDLSSNDFTDELKEKLENLEEGAGQGEVISVNGKKGVVVLNKNDIGLGHVENVEQVALTEFEDFKLHTGETLRTKVDKVEGKQLSSNDFTNQDKLKLNNLPSGNEIVQSVNEITPIEGNVTLTKESVGLGNVLNEPQATKDELEILQAKVENNVEELLNKVNKEEGKGLSSNDFTDALKKKLEGMEGGGGELPSGEYVISVNGKSGAIEIDKNSVGLENVLNKKQVIHSELEDLTQEFNQKLLTKVNVVEGKGLSEANFTHEEKSKLASINEENLEHPVTSVNGKIGEVVLNHEDVGLDNVKNIEQATKSEFTSHVNDTVKHTTTQEKGLWNSKETPEGAQAKVDEALIESKSYTDTKISEIPKFDDKHLATKEELNKHTGNNEIHVTNDDKSNINKIPKIESDLLTKVDKEVGKGLSTNDFTENYKNKVEQFDTLSSNLSTHINNGDVHLTKEQKNLVDGLPELSTNVQALDNEVERILELLGEGEEVPENGILKVIKKGHLYMLGNEVFDIINKNKVIGNAAEAFALDNFELFSNSDITHNIIDVQVTGVLSYLLPSTPSVFEGKLKNKLDLLNAKGTIIHEMQGSSHETQAIFKFIGNTFQLIIDYTALMNDDKGRIDLELTHKIISENNVSFSAQVTITSNTFVFDHLHTHTIKTQLVLNYIRELKERLQVDTHIFNNTFTINSRQTEEFSLFTYEIADPEPYLHPVIEREVEGLFVQITQNNICDELLRRVGNTFVYLPERMKNPSTPIFNKATMTHVINMELDRRPNVKFGTDELERPLSASTTSSMDKPELKNIVIVESLEELQAITPYKGLIAIVSSKE